MYISWLKIKDDVYVYQAFKPSKVIKKLVKILFLLTSIYPLLTKSLSICCKYTSKLSSAALIVDNFNVTFKEHEKESPPLI